MNIPPTTIKNSLNEMEMLDFKERRSFHSWRSKGHYYFDKIWEHKLLTRTEAYVWLAMQMNLTIEKTHFGKFNHMQCRDAIYFCQQALNDNRRCDLDFGVKPITPFYILN